MQNKKCKTVIRNVLDEPPDVTVIKEIERQSGCSLPEAYLTFLNEHHGGYPSPEVFTYGVGKQSILQHFFEFSKDTTYSILDYMESLKGRLPEGYLPIACDPGGNLIIMGLNGLERERIYFWDHEEELIGNKLYPISESFDDFICCFQETVVET